MTNYLKRLTSILADLSPTPIRARSLDFTGFQSTSHLLARVRGSIPTASLQNFYGGAFTDFLEKQCGEWDFNDRKLQSDWSDVCGQYCIFFLSHRARGYSMNKIVQLFDDNTMLNDAKVSHFVKSHFRVSVKHPNLNFIQFSKKLFNKYCS